MTEVNGGCHCGATRYRASGEIAGGGICYCSNCQSIGAGGPNYAMSLANYEITVEGNPKVYSHPGGTGQIIDKTFCATCGSHLYARGGGNGHLLRIKAGTARGTGSVPATSASLGLTCAPLALPEPGHPNLWKKPTWDGRPEIETGRTLRGLPVSTQLRPCTKRPGGSNRQSASLVVFTIAAATL